MKAYEEEEVQLHNSWTLYWMKVTGQLHAPTALHPVSTEVRERISAHQPRVIGPALRSRQPTPYCARTFKRTPPCTCTCWGWITYINTLNLPWLKVWFSEQTDEHITSLSLSFYFLLRVVSRAGRARSPFSKAFFNETKCWYSWHEIVVTAQRRVGRVCNHSSGNFSEPNTSHHSTAYTSVRCFIYISIFQR
jgi:hypothetical protein